jgi:hypothetical protein
MISPLEAFTAHPFVFLWHRGAPTSADEAVVAISNVEQKAADLIFQNEPDPIPGSTLQHLFMPYHRNGTFSIGVRRTAPLPPFLRGESGDLATWVRTVARSDLVRMLYAQALPPPFQAHRIDDVAAIVSDAFHYCGSGGRLYDQIPNQNYIDYIRRAIGLYVYRDASIEFDTERSYNEFATDVALGLIERQEQSQRATQVTVPLLRTLMVHSLLAGVIGLDMKCTHCAASLFTSDNAAASQGEAAPGRVDAIYQWLLKKATNARLFCSELFAWDAYQSKVLSRPCVMYFFPDDLGETFFDLFRLQIEMTHNRELRIVFVPRNGRFHNDCALADVRAMLEHRCFEPLRRFQDQGRFAVNTNGPKNGAVEGPKMNRHLAEAILNDADVLFFKGSRSYEMVATGIRIPAFSGQTVSREFSESVTGASSAAGVPVLRFFHAFPDYWGFTERHRRIEPLFPTGQLGWQASMTAIDSARFTASKPFRDACARRAIEDIATDIMARAEEQQIPPHQVSTGRSF